MENTALASMDAHRPATAYEIREQVNLIQKVMRAVMVEGTHYGKIPGCGDKATLYKPGSEKILTTFRIAVSPEVEDLSTRTPDGSVEIAAYRVKAVGTTPNGIIVGTGIGECSSNEDKYRWRSIVCKAEWDATDDSRKRLRYKRDGDTIQQIRTNAADIANTVLKMAKKRAQIDLCLTATAASDIFTQDIEDLPEGMEPQEEAAPPLRQPQRASTVAQPIKPFVAGTPLPEAPPEPGSSDGLGDEYIGIIKNVAEKTGKKKDGSIWTRYGVQLEDDSWVNTFSDTFGDIAKEAKKNHTQVRIAYEKTDKGVNIVEMSAE